MPDPYDALFDRLRPGRFSPVTDPNWVHQQNAPGGDIVSPYGFIDDGSVDTAQLKGGSVDFTKFASSIVPPRVVGSLPTLPDAAYPIGSTIVLTSDGKLYKTLTGLVGSWIPAVAAPDLSGQITGTQIADSSITTPKMSANTINGDRILANSLDAAKIVTDSIQAGQIAAGAIGASEIAANAVTAAQIAANTITAGQIATDTITAAQIAAGAITASELAANAVTADKLLVGGGIGQGITNPGFENGTTDGWVVWDPSGAGAFYVETIAAAGIKTGTGTYHATISKTYNPGVYPQAIASAMPCSPGAYVSASLLVGGAALEFWINWLDVNHGYISASGHSALTPSSGNQNAGTFFGPSPANTYYCQFVIANAATSGFPTYVCFDDVRVSVGDASMTTGRGNVSIDSNGIRIYNGSLTVASDGGSTVVIDGTSMMFKIAATGTIGRQMPASANSNLNNSVQLTALGNGFSVPTACIMETYVNYGAAYRWNGSIFGAVSASDLFFIGVVPSLYVSSGYINVRLDNDAYAVGFPSGYWGYARYHVLKEAGI